MSAESIVYGFIDGATYEPPQYRILQRRNKAIPAHLPEHDEFPFLSRSMFSFPRERQTQGMFRAQIIHFGGSMNGLTLH